jgi:hypothetical protein
MFSFGQVVGFALKRLLCAVDHHCHSRKPFRSPGAGLLAFLIVAAAGLISTSETVVAGETADPIIVEMDRATLIQVAAKRHTIIVGDPTIARAVNLSGSNQMVLTGLSYGETRMTLLDADGNVIASSRILVREAATSGVTVYRGKERDTYYDCERLCQPGLQLGDADKQFRDIGEQVRAREGKPASEMESGGRL